jgi:hypothetical protein
VVKDLFWQSDRSLDLQMFVLGTGYKIDTNCKRNILKRKVKTFKKLILSEVPPPMVSTINV